MLQIDGNGPRMGVMVRPYSDASRSFPCIKWPSPAPLAAIPRWHPPPSRIVVPIERRRSPEKFIGLARRDGGSGINRWFRV